MTRKKSILSGLLKPKKKKSPFSALTTPPKKPGASKKPSELPMLEVVGSETVAFEIPIGPREVRIYTYDGRALKGTRKGSVFRMNIMRGIIGMTSIYTGMQWDEEANNCVTYNGFAVGHLSGSGFYVTQIVEKYGSASIAVKRTGTDPDGGWPLLVALLPENDWFIETLNATPDNE